MLLNRLKLSKDKTELLAISSVHVLHLAFHIFMSVMRERWLRQKRVTLEFFLTNPWVSILRWLQFANRHTIISVKLASFLNISPLTQPTSCSCPRYNKKLINVTRDYLGYLTTRLNSSNVYRMQLLELLYCFALVLQFTPVLVNLHWLPIKLRIEFQIFTVTFKTRHGLLPTYIKDLLERYHPLRDLRSWKKHLLAVLCF